MDPGKSDDPVLVVATDQSNVLNYLTELLDPLEREVWSPLLPLPILPTLRAIKVTLDYRSRVRAAGLPQPALLQGMFTVMTMALGGSTTTALLLGIPPSWLASNTTLPTYAFVYFLLHHAPDDIAFRILDVIEPYIRPVLLLADGLSRANAQASFAVESARRLQNLQNSIVAQLICGTLTGCGGGILADAFSMTTGDWRLRIPRVLHEDSYDLRLSLTTAITYSFTTASVQTKATIATSPLFQLYPNAYYFDGVYWPTLDLPQAKCLAGLIFATGLYWKQYSPALLALLGSTAVSHDKKKQTPSAKPVKQ